MAAQPGLPGSQFQGQSEDYLVRRVQDLEKAVQQLAAANPFAPMGVTPTADGFTVTGTETVTGALIVNGPETVNGTQTVNGPLNVNGAMTVTGTLSLPAGIIDNAALASPVQTDTASNYVNNYAITTAITVRASITLTVPAGFTQAVVIANASAMGYNSTAVTDYLYVQAVVQGVGGGEMYSAAGAGLGVGLASPFHTTLTGLTGGDVITVSVTTRTSAATWAASVSNQANIYATALYLR
jgi:hypothetical protein